MTLTTRRRRRQFQPAIEALSLRLAPSGFVPVFGESPMDQLTPMTCADPLEMTVERNTPMVVDLGVQMPTC